MLQEIRETGEVGDLVKVWVQKKNARIQLPKKKKKKRKGKKMKKEI